MNIQIHSVRFDADKKLIDFVHQKLDKLTQIGEDIVHAEVYLRLNKDKDRENKISEIKLELQGGPLFAGVTSCANASDYALEFELGLDCNVSSTGAIVTNPENASSLVNVKYSHYVASSAYNSTGTIITNRLKTCKPNIPLPHYRTQTTPLPTVSLYPRNFHQVSL